MPELPEVEAYLTALRPRILDRPLERVRLASPFVLRSVAPPLDALVGQPVGSLRRLGKRLVLAFPGELFLVAHLMIAGRLHWRPRGAKVPARLGLAAFDFPTGTLTLTEAGTRRRAALHVVRGEAALAAHDPGGLEVLQADPAAFGAALARERHTLKRALTDPRVVSGIGNVYADEILHRARLSPVRLSDQLEEADVARLLAAAREVLREWTARLIREAGEGFPEQVSAIRPGRAVHGRYGEPCPTCGAPIQRIVYAENETNYCARCQTAGRLLADRALSRLLKRDWPRTLDELELLRGGLGRPPDAPPLRAGWVGRRQRRRPERSEARFRCDSSGGGRHGQPGPLPGVDAALEGLHVREPARPILRCLTGSRALLGSGAVEDELLVLRQRGQPAFEAPQGDRALQRQLGALALVLVGTHEQRAPGFRLPAGFLDVDAWDLRHAWPPRGRRFRRAFQRCVQAAYRRHSRGASGTRSN